MNSFKEIIIRNNKILIFSFLVSIVLASIYQSIVPEKFTAIVNIKIGENGGILVINPEDFVDQLKIKTKLYESLVNLYLKNGGDNADIVILSLSSIKALPSRKNVEITIVTNDIDTTNKVANDLGITIETKKNALG
jgi:hypothetical protein